MNIGPAHGSQLGGRLSGDGYARRLAAYPRSISTGLVIMPELRPSEVALVEDADSSSVPFCVLVANETDWEIEPERVRAAVLAALDGSPYESAEVSVAIVDDLTIHRLNRQFLGHDHPTDVLSFSLEDAPPRLEGEIIVSVDTAARSAADAGWQANDELLLYVVHGALHLAGYRDKTPADAAAMRAREGAVLARLSIRTSSRDDRWQPEAPEDDRT